MSNIQRGEVKIMLDKERTLKFDLNALIDVEDELGFPLAELGERGVTIKALRSLLFAGLSHEDSELTVRQVGSLITMDNIGEVQDALTKAMGSVKN